MTQISAGARRRLEAVFGSTVGGRISDVLDAAGHTGADQQFAVIEMDIPWEPGLPVSPEEMGEAAQEHLLWSVPHGVSSTLGVGDRMALEGRFGSAAGGRIADLIDSAGGMDATLGVSARLKLASSLGKADASYLADFIESAGID